MNFFVWLLLIVVCMSASVLTWIWFMDRAVQREVREDMK